MLTTVLISISVCTALWAVIFFRLYLQHKKQLQRRMLLVLGDSQTNASWIVRYAERFDHSSAGTRLAEQLRESQLPVQPSEYAAYYLLSHVVVVWFLNSFVGLPVWLAILVTITGLDIAKRFLISSRKSKNIQLLNRQMPEVCRLLGNSLRSGLTILQGFELLAKELPVPSRGEFLQLQRELELGEDFEQIMLGFQKRMQTRECDLFAGALIIQRRIGGNLVVVLEKMAITLEGRTQLQESIKTMTAEAKYISYILPVVPLVLLIMMNSLIDGFLDPLLTIPGMLLIGVFVAVQAAAFFAVRKISGVRV